MFALDFLRIRLAHLMLLGIDVPLVGAPSICVKPRDPKGLKVVFAGSKRGSVLDVEMTMLDKQSKGVPIDEQANDDVVHLDRFREADRLPDQAFDPCA